MFGVMGSIGGGLGFVIYDFPRIVVRFVITGLIIALFMIESETGCNE